jgi:intracellular sulfur oxidation DsrE/DsrF family protein
MMNKGVTVLVCPDCMKQYGVKPADLIDGVQIGKPGQTHGS